MRAWMLLLAAAAVAGCVGSDDESLPAVPGGILFRNVETRLIESLEGGPVASSEWPSATGFDADDALLVQGDGELLVQRVGGEQRRVATPGLFNIGRPSLSPDGAHVAVQGTTTERLERPSDIHIHLVDLATGVPTRFSDAADPEESPEWSPDGRFVAFVRFSLAEGVNVHVREVATGTDSIVLRDAGASHVSWSKDSGLLFVPTRGQLLDVATGDVTADIRGALRAGIEAAGFELDERHPGQANLGTCPLDGELSPDGSQVVFDCAVEKDGQFGIVVATARSDGSDVRVVAGPFRNDPARTNNNNFSETTPMWG